MWNIQGELVSDQKQQKNHEVQNNEGRQLKVHFYTYETLIDNYWYSLNDRNERTRTICYKVEE